LLEMHDDFDDPLNTSIDGELAPPALPADDVRHTLLLREESGSPDSRRNGRRRCARAATTAKISADCATRTSRIGPR
jgi:hypothetical protein